MQKTGMTYGIAILFVSLATLQSAAARDDLPNPTPYPTGFSLPEVNGATIGASDYTFDWSANMNTAAPSISRGTSNTGNLMTSSYSGDANISSVSNHVSAQGGGTVGAGTAFQGGSDSIRRSGSNYVDTIMGGNRGGDTYETLMRAGITLPRSYAINPHGLIPDNNTGSGKIVTSTGTGLTASVGKVENQGGKMKYDRVNPEAKDAIDAFNYGSKR